VKVEDIGCIPKVVEKQTEEGKGVRERNGKG
jgi:hypothetical protein